MEGLELRATSYGAWIFVKGSRKERNGKGSFGFGWCAYMVWDGVVWYVYGMATWVRWLILYI